MGYRSDVGIKCEQKAFEMFREAYEKHDFLPQYIYKDGDFYTIVWEWVKWYEGYPEIAAITEVMDKLSSDDYDYEGYSYAFNRIGESDDDNEHRDNDWDLEFYIERSFPRKGEQLDVTNPIPKSDVQLSQYLQEGA